MIHLLVRGLEQAKPANHHGIPEVCQEFAVVRSYTVRREVTMKLTLSIIPETLTICPLQANEDVPRWATAASFWSITKTTAELSIVVTKECVPAGVRTEGTWRALKIAGPIPLSAVGILASVAEPLAKARVNLFAISTFDTDYVLVPADRLEDARLALSDAGHMVS
jgi:hypothetical protein